MKPIELVYLDHTQDDLDEDGPQTLSEIAQQLQRRRPSAGDGMTLQSDTPDAMLRWLQSSMA